MVEHFEAGQKEWRELFRHQNQRDDSYLAEWRHFLSCASQNEEPLITGEDGLKVLQIVDAARNASEAGSQIRVERMQEESKARA
jgi:predicted dehydrogenase